MDVRIAVLVSGTGSNLQALLNDPHTAPRIALVVSSNPHAPALDRARSRDVKALVLDPKRAGAHNGLGFVLRQQGKLPEAVAKFREAIALNPNHALAQSNLRGTLVQMKLYVGVLFPELTYHRRQHITRLCVGGPNGERTATFVLEFL